MKFNGKKGSAFLAGFLYMTAALSPVWADDTEIYFGNVGGGGATANLLFILDTSGSMDTVDTDSDSSNTLSRMDQMKNSMNALLDTLTNVNVGIMRFSNPGGPVLYPVSGLDSIAVGTGVVNAKVVNNDDDGYQYTANTNMVLNRAGLELGAQAPSGATIAAVTTAIVAASSGSSNDASTDVQAGTSKFIDAPLYSPTDQDDGSHQRVNGLRFTGIAIPKSAVITRAYLQFQVYGTGTVDALPLQLDILGEAVDVGTFNIASARLPSTRIATTANILPQFAGVAMPVVWTMNTLPSTDDIVRSTDIASIIQGIVNNSAWASGNSMTLLYRKTAASTSKNWVNFSSFDRSGGIPPKLVIEYYPASPVPTPSAVTTAVRFPSVYIPKGVTIKGAYLNFVAQQSDTNSAAITIKAEASGNSAAITTSSRIVGRSTTSSSVTWSTAGGNLTSWIANNLYSTPDLKAMVQEVVNRNDWCGGNAMTLLLTGTAGQRVASALEDGAALAPQLSIQYDPATVPETGGCVNASTIAQINAGNDDVEEYGSNNTQALSDEDMEMAAVKKNNKNSTQKIGFLFRNIQVPQGQTITSAYLQFTAKDSNSQTVALTISGENTAKPKDYSAANKLSPRSTVGSVAWSPESWTKGNIYNSPDIAGILQQLVNKTDWASGNNISLVVTGTGTNADNIRRPYSYDASPSRSAKLIINYKNSLQPKITVRTLLKNTVDDLVASGNTPIQDTMYEAALYFSGSNVVYGSQRGGPLSIVSTTSKEAGPYSTNRISNSKSFTGGMVVRPSGCTEANLSDPSCAGEKVVQANLPGAGGQYSSGAKYISPVTVSCQVNHVVLLTDGEANSPHSSALARTLTGVSSCAEPDTRKNEFGQTISNGKACVAEMATWLKNGDMAPTVAGMQGVITDTVAFHLKNADAVSFLNDVAIKGGSLKQGVYQANSATELSKALGDIVGQVSNSNSSFVAAGTAVNAFNRTENRNELYFSVFKPAITPRWPGNMKKYRSGTIGGNPAILDKTGANAVDNGFFAPGSTDFWNTGAADGADVTKGGAASLITNYSTRKVYTYLDNIATPSKVLSNVVNRLAGDNPNLTLAHMGGDLPVLAGDPYAYTLADLIDWSRGKDVQNAGARSGTRYVFADPLHSRPVAVTYGGTEANPDISVFVSTNSGFLHAIDNSTGAEQFAFIPRELLPLQKLLFENLASTPHPSGLDGAITLWVKDPDGDGVVLNTAGQLQADNSIYLYVGMRRGGRNIYALDVSDRANPKVLWTIKGGVTTGFNNLGQTWSQPLKAKVKIGSATRDVLIFAGGYASNGNQDNSVQRDVLATDTDGNAIYVVDAANGDLLWSGSSASGANTVFPDMKYSIPSTMAGADINLDGLLDVLFVGDMGGQLWRFDVQNGKGASELLTGGVIADLNAASATPTAANNRRFFHAPALFWGQTSKKESYIGVAIGSGYRAHPLNNTTEDRFYMIRQPVAAPKATETYAKLTEASLYDATDNVIGEGSDIDKKAAITYLEDTAVGWYLTMDNQGEKVLSTPLVVEGLLYFNTYQPGAPPNTDPCAPATGINRSYTMSAFDATPVLMVDGKLQRSSIINASGIIDRQIQVFVDGGAVGFEGSNPKKLPSGVDDNIYRMYWYENREGK